jgi:hypothetical protein
MLPPPPPPQHHNRGTTHNEEKSFIKFTPQSVDQMRHLLKLLVLLKLSETVYANNKLVPRPSE